MDNVDLSIYNDNIRRLYKSYSMLSLFYDLCDSNKNDNGLNKIIESKGFKSLECIIDKVKDTAINLNEEIVNKSQELISNIDIVLPVISKDYRDKIPGIADTNKEFLYFSLNRLNINFRLFYIIKRLIFDYNYKSLLEFKTLLFDEYKNIDFINSGIAINNNNLKYILPNVFISDTTKDIKNDIKFIGNNIEYLCRSSKSIIKRLLISIQSDQELNTSEQIQFYTDKSLIISFTINDILLKIITDSLKIYKYLIFNKQLLKR